MCLDVESPDIAGFEPTRAIELWLRSGTRRKRIEHGEKEKSSTSKEEAELSEEEHKLYEDREELEEEETEVVESDMDGDIFEGLKKADPHCYSSFTSDESDDEKI